ncbi:MAG: MotE family protein [Thermodesulfobacteriota bacterium]
MKPFDKKDFRQKSAAGVLAAVVAAFFLIAGSVYAEDSQEVPQVVFKCEDIGVQARRMLSRLEKERSRFARQKEEISRRKEELKILQDEVDEKLERLKQMRGELGEMLDEKQDLDEEKARKLSKIYQKREPAAAAQSLAAMDKDLAVSVLALMRDKYAGEILDNMENSVAVDYSTALGSLQGAR